MKKNLFLLLSLMISLPLYAGSNFQLDDISQKEIDDLTEELAADFVYTNVTSAKVTGDIIPLIGFEVGVVLGVTDAPTWNKLIKEQDPNTTIDKLPYANLYLSASFKPLNLSFDLAMIPEQKSDNAYIKNTAVAVKWTFLNGPLQLAVKTHFTSNELGYTDTINNSSTANLNITGKTSFDTTIYGAQILAGADLVVIEPYIGLGFVKSSTDTKLEALGSTTIFDQTVTANAEGAVESSHSSVQIIAGVALDLFIPNFGVEYMSVHGTTKITGKFGLSF